MDIPVDRKIALFVKSFLPYSQTFIDDEIRAHSDTYETTVFCQDRQNEDRFQHNAVISCKNSVEKMLYKNFRVNSSFDKALKKGSFDLIHAHFGTTAVYALPFAKRHNLPMVVTFHGYDVAALMGRERSKFHNRRYAKISEEIFSYSSLIFAASEELKALLIELGAHPDKVRIYRLGIDLNRFSYSEPQSAVDSFQFLMIGRFTSKKGHVYAINALKKVIESGHKAKLALVGDGENRNMLQGLVKSLDLQSHVDFLGIKTSDEISSLLSDSHTLLAPSVTTFEHDRESGLIVIKEAAAVGVPSIGTWHGGIPEIIEHDETGLLVPERSTTSLAEAMIEMIENDDKRVKMAKAARSKMEKQYDLFERVKNLEQLYEEALR